MPDINYKIKIGKYRLAMLEAVKITQSIEQLADLATITLPARVNNRLLVEVDKIKVGDVIEIALGYDGQLNTEFEGYLKQITIQGGKLLLTCEDGVWLSRKKVPNTTLIHPDLKDVLQVVATAMGGYTVVTNYSRHWDKFVMHDTTGYDVLKKVGEECGLNIYLRGKELRAEPRDFEHTDGRAVYDFEKNIEKDDLIYRRADEREYEVTVEGIGKGGKRKTITLGTGGGGKRKIIIPGVTDEAILRKRGEEEMKHLLYDGFDGNITGWAIPFVQAGYSVEMRNHETPTQTGTYHCTAMELDGSKAGLVRKVTLGRKLSL